MPYAVTHVLSTVLLVDLFRHHAYHFPRKYLIAVAFFALFPDLDIVFGTLYRLLQGDTLKHALVNGHAYHGLWTHNFIIPVMLGLIALLLYLMHYRTATLVLGLLAFGWFFHVFLDLIAHGISYPMMLWPFYKGPLFEGVLPLEGLAPLDAVLFLLWITHEELAHRIKEYF